MDRDYFYNSAKMLILTEIISKNDPCMCGLGLNVTRVRIPTGMLGGDLGSALFAPPLFPLLLASFLLITVGLSSVALPNLTLLPLDGFRTGVSSKLRLQLHHACPDRMTLSTGLIAL